MYLVDLNRVEYTKFQKVQKYFFHKIVKNAYRK